MFLNGNFRRNAQDTKPKFPSPAMRFDNSNNPQSAKCSKTLGGSGPNNMFRPVSQSLCGCPRYVWGNMSDMENSCATHCASEEETGPRRTDRRNESDAQELPGVSDHTDDALVDSIPIGVHMDSTPGLPRTSATDEP